MAKTLTPKVLVVGAGPGGYVAAIRAGQLGLDCVLAESERLGGTCLIRGCIPSKALIHVAGKFEAMAASVGKGRCGIRLNEAPVLDMAETVRWKEQIVDKLNGGVAALLRKAKVQVVEGRAEFSDGKTCAVATTSGSVMIKAEHVILATGSTALELSGLPFGGPVISSTEALSLERLPARLVVIGAGYIGLELGIAYRKFGSKVTVVEALDQVLPQYDKELVQPVERWLERAGVTVHLGAKATGLRESANGCTVSVQTRDGAPIDVVAEKVLVTVGRKPATEGWGLENMAIDMDGRYIKVDDQCRTSMRDVWAIGDVIGEPMLAHKASAQGEMVAEIIAGQRRAFDPVAIPAVCFTEPEIVTVGMLPADAARQGIETTSGIFPFAANGRALSMEAADVGGFVRVLARRDNRRVLGIHAVGVHVSELSGEFAHALEMGAVLEDIAGTIHQHPTLSEAFHEAALRSLGHAIHI
jgi:dihydrolipoamide dehydrogenase